MQARSVCTRAYKTKVCQNCGKEYQPTGVRQKYCSKCAPSLRTEKARARVAKWEKVNPEKVKAKNAKQRKENAARAARWAKKHPEREMARHAKWRKKNLEKRKEYCAKWKNKNPERIAVSGSKRRALKYANTPINELLTSTEWLAILAEANGHCTYCDKEAKLTLDHITPLSRGGTHSKSNVVAACLHCNASKGTKTVEAWLAQVAQ